MTVAVMQPYIFPYLGYYQLVAAVDTFVFFDDVNFIKRGWINRNQLLQNGKPYRFTIPLKKASQNRLINEIELADYTNWRNDFLNTVENCYKKAPHFLFVFSWLKDFFSTNYVYINELAIDSIKAVASLLELPVLFKHSSAINYKGEQGQNGAEKVLAICKILNADKYINPKNGVELYNRQQFLSFNKELHFINMHPITYPQFKEQTFVPNLSIIDVLMFNSIQDIQKLLGEYSFN